jgi:prepilin-type N-terminal cleavage/methylation domain-containing protein
MNRKHFHKQGFTLVEVLMAIFILAIVMTMIYMTFGRTMASAEKVGRDNDAFHAARVLLDRLTYELMNTYLKKNVTAAPGEDVSQPTSIFQAASERSDRYGWSSLSFTTVSNYVIPGYGHQSDLVQVMYYVEPDPDGEGGHLRRREYKIPVGEVGSSDACDAESLCNEFTAIPNILGFEVSFYNDEKYGDKFSKTEWDSTATLDSNEYNRPPRAARINLILPSANDSAPLFFTTAVMIPAGEDSRTPSSGKQK